MRSRARMCLRLTALVALTVGGACAHDERVAAPGGQALAPLDAGAPDVTHDPPQYLVADAGGGRSRLFVMPLGTVGKAEGQGVILDGVRIVLLAGAEGATRGQPRTRVARDVADPALSGAERIPPWLGGGFLFRSPSALYTSATFDGPLRPLVTVPGTIESVHFGPRSALVRADNGERWSLDPRTGLPAPSAPPGLVDVVALPDGRAVAMVEFGGVLVTTDGGARWSDVTRQLPGPAESVASIDDQLYVNVAAPTSGGNSRALRLEPGGSLATFNRTPVVKPPELRPTDPRWTAKEPPLRRVMRLGVPLDDSTAVVVSEGSVVKVDLSSGELLSVAPGRLPPEATCEAVRAQEDVVLACTRSGHPSFVASHLGTDKAPVIEQTFAAAGRFFAGDDGSLAFGGPCTRSKASPLVACVRSAGGTWREHDFELALGDGGTSGLEVTRWVPRADGSVVGIVTAPKLGTLHSGSSELMAWQIDGIQGGVKAFTEASGGRGKPRSGETARVVDRAWSFTASGTLRGWIDPGAVEIGLDGQAVLSPFSFDRMASAGALAFAVSKDNRAWQTVDRGNTWTEVAAPVVARSERPNDRVLDPRACGPVGCDLGSWYRVGWLPVAPRVTPSPTMAAPPQHVALTRPATLECKTTGELRVTSAVRGEHSPDDLGLGNQRLPVADENANVEVVRTLFGRVALNPPHNADVGPDRDEAAPRAIVHGYGVSTSDDRIRVMGPSRDPMALRRHVSYLAPFDPSGQVRRGSFGVPEIMASARSIGLSSADVLSEDPTTVTAFTPLLAGDAAAPGDLAFLGANGLVGTLRTVRSRVTMRVKPSEDTMPVSAVALAGDEMALLELDAEGKGHAFKWAGGGINDLFDIPAPAASLYPANADALAVGVHNELAVVRTPSGGVPPSADDPALLYVPGSPPTALAAWSALLTADDAACKSEPGGWRTIVQTVRPWVAINSAGLRSVEDAPCFARVRWTASRVCLEAVEIRVDDVKLRPQERSGGVGPSLRTSTLDTMGEAWVIARFSGGPTAARVVVVPGAEGRQPLDCTLTR